MSNDTLKHYYISCGTVEDVECEVNEKIREGYKISGSLCCVLDDGVAIYAQPLVLNLEKDQ